MTVEAVKAIMLSALKLFMTDGQKRIIDMVSE